MGRPERDPEVDRYVERAQRWQAETKKLRAILLACGLRECLKWGKPCYTHRGANVAIVQGFKAHCALMFFRGAELDDPGGHLRSQGKHTQSAKRLQFTSTADVAALEPAVRAFVAQAVGLGDGPAPPRTAPPELPYPTELEERLTRDADLRRAFEALTPGRRRHYLMHFSDAKQSKTRAARIERCAPRIVAGKGLNDR